ncbi:MAG: PAS domain S-box protein [Bacteroidota bacterium]
MVKRGTNLDSYSMTAFSKDQSAVQLIFDRETGQILEVNQSALQFYGWSREEMRTMRIEQINTLDPQKIREIINSIRPDRKSHFEFRHRRADGSVRDVEVFSATVYMNDREYIHSIIFDISDKKKMERELLETEAVYRSIFNASPDLIIFADLQLNIYFVSPKTYEAFGYNNEDQILGRSILDFIRSSEHDTVRRRFDLLMKYGVSGPAEYTARRVDGSEFDMEVNVEFIRNHSEEPSGIVIIARDISARKDSLRQTRQSEEKYRSIFENAPLGIFQFNSQGIITECNDIFIGIIGSSRKALIGLDMHRLQNKQIVANLAGTLEGKTTVYEGDYTSVTGNKTTPVRVMFNAVFNENGEVDGGIGIVEDISERREAESALQQSELKFKSLIDLAVDAILLGDPNGAIIGVNEQAARLTGYSKEELLSCNIRALFSDEELSKVPLRYDLLQQGETVRNNRLLKTRDGRLIPIEMNTKLMPDSTYQTFIRDMTERYRAEEELRVALEKAQESDRLKSAFLANMSHEIRTPMNGILGFAELLKRSDLTGEKKDEYLDIIRKSGLRMLSIINDLIDISKVESGQMEVELSSVDINEQLDYVHDFFGPEVSGKGLSISVSKTLEPPHSYIETDREKLLAILINLVKNAVKFTFKGSIRFGYELRDQVLEFFVSDSGTGIPEEKLDSIFERFVQADLSMTKNYEGAGLGLSISRAYVEMLGGTIRVESVVNQGSDFYFTIPYIASEKAEQDKEENDNGFRESSPAGIRVLIAEDEEVSMNLLSIMAQDFASAVVCASTGGEAVRRFKEHPGFDLVLMDIKMPDMDGYEATRRIREMNPEVVIIAQSAYALSGDREKAIKAGCNDYVVKPVAPEALRARIAQYFGDRIGLTRGGTEQ